MSKRLTDEEYTEQVYYFIDLCMASLEEEGMSIPAMARAMGLSPVSLHRAVRHDTRFFRVLTVQKIGDYAGMQLLNVSGRPRMKIVRKRRVA